MTFRCTYLYLKVKYFQDNWTNKSPWKVDLFETETSWTEDIHVFSSHSTRIRVLGALSIPITHTKLKLLIFPWKIDESTLLTIIDSISFGCLNWTKCSVRANPQIKADIHWPVLLQHLHRPCSIESNRKPLMNCIINAST